MSNHATETTLCSQEQKSTQNLPEETTAFYEVHLRLSGLPAGDAEEIRSMIETALSVSTPDGLATVVSVTEGEPVRGEGWIEERITPLHVLFCTLPTEFQRPDILPVLAEHYHRELAILWQTVRHTGCIRGAIELRQWRRAGAQWICEFLSYDRGALAGSEANLHGQNISQWQNRQTGWSGHQGAIVLDTSDGQITSHH